MANTESLPIFNATRKFITEYAVVYEKMKNLHKYHIGSFIYDKAMSLIVHIIKANSSNATSVERVEILQSYLDDLCAVRCGLRIAGDAKVIDSDAEADLSSSTTDLARQVKGWRNHTIAGIPGFKDSGRDA